MFELYAPLITPFDKDENVDEQGFLNNLAWYDTQPLDGYLINGSSGEADMLSAAEQLRLLELTCQSTDRPIFAGIAPTSVRVAVEEIERLRELPLAAVLVRTPSYFGAQLEQRIFYRAVADASPHPIVIYQIPQNTGVKLDERTLYDLAQHPNIIGIKDSLGDLSLLQEVDPPDSFRYLLGAANLLLPGLRAGAVGGILALADVVPSACRALLDLAAAGEWEKAQQLQRGLIPLSRAIGGSRGYGIAGLKGAVELLGLCGGPPRRPLAPLKAEGRKNLRAMISQILG
jgi:4-hydroxy-2-oxoglutarate aldolase